MTRALEALAITPDHVLVDGNDGRVGWPSTAVIKGDSLVACIAAASVIAKVERDALMVTLSAEHPGYGLEINKGYYTEQHNDATRNGGERIPDTPAHGPTARTMSHSQTHPRVEVAAVQMAEAVADPEENVTVGVPA